MPWTRRTGPALAWMLGCATLTHCAPMTAIGAIDASAGVAPTVAFCHLARPIPWSRDDTAATIAAVKTHNAGYASLCPPAPDL